MVFEDNPAKRESLYHTALVFTKKISIGTQKADSELERLLKSYGSFENIFKVLEGDMFSREVEEVQGIGKVIDKLEKISFNFKVLTVNDRKYPSYLSAETASPVLYTQGDTELLETKSIAVVGTRGRNGIIGEEDRKEGENILERLVKSDHAIVSGLALGCDTLAHCYALSQGGRTTAVLGTPLDKFYPRENKGLQKEIGKNHLVASPYPMGIKTFPFHFAHRNKTTVGLSTEGITVIQAGDKSGTMHAVRHCVKQGKPVYALANNFGRGYKWVEKYSEAIKIPNKNQLRGS
jgi:DNA processing protein